MTTTWKAILPCLLAALLAGCAGIPLGSMPRLMSLQKQLLDLDPAQFMVAIQIDARMPPPREVPVIELVIRPREPGMFEPVDKKLPMRIAPWPGGSRGLEPASAGRRWMVYSIPPESHAELVAVQSYFRKLQAEKPKGGGSVAIGISQAGMPATDPALADTKWESWLQTSHREGFYEIWSGPVSALVKQALGEK
jgi:hypothetical protein